jgi:hypothetical protein
MRHPRFSYPPAKRGLLPVLRLRLATSGGLCSFGGCGDGVNAGDVTLVSLDEEGQMGDPRNPLSGPPRAFSPHPATRRPARAPVRP